MKLSVALSILIFSLNINAASIPSRYSHLKKTRLSEVLSKLEGNDNNLESFLSDVEYLDASWHQLHKLDFEDLIDRLPNLKVFDASHNELSSISNSFLKSLSKIKSLNIAANRFKAATNILFDKYLINLEELNLSQNGIKNFYLPNIPSLISLDLSDNELKNLDIFYKSNLQFLNLAGNKFKLTKKHKKKLINLKYLDLTNNGLGEISLEEISFPSLEILILSHNHIENLPNGAENLPLKELDISYTGIRKLPKFTGLISLKCGGVLPADLTSQIINNYFKDKHRNPLMSYSWANGKEVDYGLEIPKAEKIDFEFFYSLSYPSYNSLSYDEKVKWLYKKGWVVPRYFDVESILSNQSPISQLVLINDTSESYNWIVQHPSLKNLKKLGLNGCRKVDLNQIDKLHKLSHLDLSNSILYNGEELITNIKLVNQSGNANLLIDNDYQDENVGRSWSIFSDPEKMLKSTISQVPSVFDWSAFSNLKELSLTKTFQNVNMNKHLHVYPKLPFGGLSYGWSKQLMKSPVPFSEIIKIRSQLPNINLEYFNPFIDGNQNSAPLEIEPVSLNSIDEFYSFYKLLKKKEDNYLSILVLERALDIAITANPCSEKRLLLELESIENIEDYTNSENKINVLVNGEVVQESVVFSRYRKVYNLFKVCDFENTAGINKVKSKMYAAYMNAVHKMEREHALREARIQRLINSVSNSGTVAGVGALAQYGSYNQTTQAFGMLAQGGAEWSATSAEERARYLKQVNRKLMTEIVEFKQMANSFLD